MTTDFPMNFRRPLATVCMVAIAFLRTGAASASGLPVPLPPGPHRPDADSGPTKVSVGMWTADIVNVDSARQTFEGSIYIVLRWHDPHLAHSEPGITTYALNDIWYPKWSAENGSGSLRQILPEKVEVTVDGTVASAVLSMDVVKVRPPTMRDSASATEATRISSR